MSLEVGTQLTIQSMPLWNAEYFELRLDDLWPFAFLSPASCSPMKYVVEARIIFHGEWYWGLEPVPRNQAV